MLNDLKAKLREQPDLLTHVTIHGQAPIHQAAMNGYLKVIDFLAEQGTDMNVRDRSGKTALHIAVERGNLSVVEHLIQMGGIDLNAMEPFYSSPLHIAAVKGFLAIATALVEAGADLNQVTGFNRSNGNPGRNIYLGQGLPTIEQGRRGGRNSQLFTTFLTAGNSPLHYSSLLGFTKMSELFIEKGANLNVTNRCGLTPLLFQLAHSIAEPQRLLETTQLLLNHGADPNVMGVVEEADDFFWRSGLFSSRSQPKESTYFQMYEISTLPIMGIRKNLVMESKPDDRDQLWGWTSPLHVGVVLGDEITRLLIKHGADINSQNFVGVTPIQSLMSRRTEHYLLNELMKLASGQGDIDPVVHHINPNLKDDMGYRAIDWALFVDRHIEPAKGLMSLVPEENREEVAYETFWNHFGSMESRPATQKFLGELISDFPQLRAQLGPNDLLPLEQTVMDANREALQWLREQGVPLRMTPLLQEKKKELEAYFNANSNQIRDDTDRNKWTRLEMLQSLEQ
jgi:ankyrin repeat protein